MNVVNLIINKHLVTGALKMMEGHPSNQNLKFGDFVQLLQQTNGTLSEPVDGVDFERLLWALYNFFWTQTELDDWFEVFGCEMKYLDEIMMRYINHLAAPEKETYSKEGQRETLKFKLRRLITLVGPLQDIFLFFTVKIFDDKFDQCTFKEREIRLGKYLLQRMETCFRDFPKYSKLFDDDVSDSEYYDDEM